MGQKLLEGLNASKEKEKEIQEKMLDKIKKLKESAD
mgnify:CR=1 FL=1|jgi:hypothetical protein